MTSRETTATGTFAGSDAATSLDGLWPTEAGCCSRGRAMSKYTVTPIVAAILAALGVLARHLGGC